MHKIYESPDKSKPSLPRRRRSLRSQKDIDDSSSLNDSILDEYIEQSDELDENELYRDESDNNNVQITESSSEEDEIQFKYLPNRSRTISPERDTLRDIKSQNIKSENINIYSYFFIFIIIIAIIFLILPHKNEVRTQSISNPAALSEAIKNIKAVFHNQESYIWNDISSAINEVITRNPKIPSIILLFAKETSAMDCLATKLAHASSVILHADKYLEFHPEDFGNDPGEIITTLNEYSPEKKKVIMIRDILNINTEAIKALHNLCDRVNPLIQEAIYILTMQTGNYQSTRKKLDFVENEIYNKLLKNIDQDILTALVTRITDGAIILVKSEPQLRYC